MATAKFSLGSVNITDYLIVRCRKASDPIPEVTRQEFGPNPPANINLVFLDLDPEEYLFDVYESVDGVALTQFFNTYLFDVPTNTMLEEWVFYTVNGSDPEDPAESPNTQIVDSYLDGKNVVSFQQRGLGALRPTIEWTRTSTGIQLAGNVSFNDSDVFCAVINYRITGGSTGNTSTQQEATITANITLNSSYYGKIINLNGTGTRLAVTMDSVASVPDGTEFLFVDQEGGLQLQTKILFQTGEYVLWNGANMPEIWVGKGEFLRIKKNGSRYKVIQDSGGLLRVGYRFSATYIGHPNCHAEDNGLTSADDYPRIWWWINNKIPIGSKIIDDNLDAGGYVRDAAAPGFFIISTTKRLFRFPNTQDLSEKGLANFNAYAGDLDRLNQNPGGKQNGAVGKHRHVMHGFGPISTPGNPNLYLSTQNTGPYAHSWSGGGTAGLGGSVGPDINLQTGDTGDINIVDNFGVIYMRCI
jgi:hypothetical protein